MPLKDHKRSPTLTKDTLVLMDQVLNNAMNSKLFIDYEEEGESVEESLDRARKWIQFQLDRRARMVKARRRRKT